MKEKTKMKKDNCPYCQQGEFLAKFGYLAFETETSEVIVFKDQSHPVVQLLLIKKIMLLKSKIYQMKKEMHS